MKKPLTLLAILLLFATTTRAARESKHIHEDIDPYSGQKTLTLEVDTGSCPDAPTPGPSQVRLLISATQLDTHQVAYNLTTDLTYGGIVDAGKHGVLDTLVDGLPGQLPMGGPKSRWRTRGFLERHRHNRETIPYDVSLDYLQTLAQARLLQFRINGQTHSVQRCATAHQLRDLHEFLDAAASY